MTSKYFVIAALVLGAAGLNAQDVFSSNGSDGCPRGTRRFYASRYSYDPKDGCLTPGQAYMQYGQGFPVGDVYASGGPVIAQAPEQKPGYIQGGVTYTERNPAPPSYYPPPAAIPVARPTTNPPLSGGTSANRQPVQINWKPYRDAVGQQLNGGQAQALNGIDPNTLSRWRQARVRADANFTTYPNGTVSNVVVTSQDPQYRDFIKQVIESRTGTLPGFPQGTAQSSMRIGWSFTVNQNLQRSGSTVEQR